MFRALKILLFFLLISNFSFSETPTPTPSPCPYEYFPPQGFTTNFHFIDACENLNSYNDVSGLDIILCESHGNIQICYNFPEGTIGTYYYANNNYFGLTIDTEIDCTNKILNANITLYKYCNNALADLSVLTLSNGNYFIDCDKISSKPEYLSASGYDVIKSYNYSFNEDCCSIDYHLFKEAYLWYKRNYNNYTQRCSCYSIAGTQQNINAQFDCWIENCDPTPTETPTPTPTPNVTDTPTTTVPTPTPLDWDPDSDGDNIPDSEDPDDDNDQISDEEESETEKSEFGFDLLMENLKYTMHYFYDNLEIKSYYNDVVSQFKITSGQSPGEITTWKGESVSIPASFDPYFVFIRSCFKGLVYLFYMLYIVIFLYKKISQDKS